MREWFWKRMVDSRGKVVRIPPPSAAYRRGAGHDAATVDDVRAALYGLPSGVLPRAGFALALAAGAFFGVYHVSLEHMSLADARRSGIILGAMLACGAFVAGMRLGVQPTDQYRLGQAFYECLSCPRCGYDLHGLPLDQQNDAICPECECAWRMPAPTKPG